MHGYQDIRVFQNLTRKLTSRLTWLYADGKWCPYSLFLLKQAKQQINLKTNLFLILCIFTFLTFSAYIFKFLQSFIQTPQEHQNVYCTYLHGSFIRTKTKYTTHTYNKQYWLLHNYHKMIRNKINT